MPGPLGSDVTSIERGRRRSYLEVGAVIGFELLRGRDTIGWAHSGATTQKKRYSSAAARARAGVGRALERCGVYRAGGARGPDAQHVKKARNCRLPSNCTRAGLQSPPGRPLARDARFASAIISIAGAEALR